LEGFVVLSGLYGWGGYATNQEFLPFGVIVLRPSTIGKDMRVAIMQVDDPHPV